MDPLYPTEKERDERETEERENEKKERRERVQPRHEVSGVVVDYVILYIRLKKREMRDREKRE